jgi:putative transposase
VWLPAHPGAVIAGVIFSTDRGSAYTAMDFTNLCRKLGVRQSMDRVGVVCLDNAACEAFFSTLECSPGTTSRRRHRPARSITAWC